MENQNMQLKAYKLLAQLRGQMLNRIMREACNKVQYCKDEPQKSHEWMEYISNPSKWQYCGLLSNEDKKVIEILEYLLNDNATEIAVYKE